jgi:hypothetical protein
MATPSEVVFEVIFGRAVANGIVRAPAAKIGLGLGDLLRRPALENGEFGGRCAGWYWQRRLAGR